MRVRISYSVELEEVPREVSRILDQACTQASELRDHLDKLIYDIEQESAEPNRVAKTFEELRALLTSLDHQLADIAMIIQGYYQATAEPVPTGEKDIVSEG